MKLITLATCTLPVSLVAANGIEPRLNEVYASHTGTDDQEFIELIGTPGFSLDGHMVLIVEGEGANAGILDRAWDLTTHAIRADGFFVLGDTAVSASNFDIGASNRIENGTETIYLVQTDDPAAILALLGMHVETGPTTTSIPSMSTVLDLVAPVDSGFPGGDIVYDGAQPVGPDGSFFPAGIFRGLDAPNRWCTGSFLDFDDIANVQLPRTPGDPNVGCLVGTIVCTPGLPNSTGNPAEIFAYGSDVVADNTLTLAAVEMPPNENGYFLANSVLGAPVIPPGSSGNFCLNGGPDLGRFVAQLQNSGAGGTFSIAVDVNNVPAATGQPPVRMMMPGVTWHFQCWHRDGTSSNFSDGISIQFQ